MRRSVPVRPAWKLGIPSAEMRSLRTGMPSPEPRGFMGEGSSREPCCSHVFACLLTSYQIQTLLTARAGAIVVTTKVSLYRRAASSGAVCLPESGMHDRDARHG